MFTAKTRRRLISILALGCLVICPVLFAGCGKKQEEDPYANGMPYIASTADLARDNFYLETKDGYIAPYYAAVNFEAYKTVTGSNFKRVAWFDEKTWERIPTLYKGEAIVYRTAQPFSEKFYFEKFLDLGYSLGICGLTPSQVSGRYSLDLAEAGTCLSPLSSAALLTNLGDGKIVLDAIDGVPLRKNSISECGSISNLQKDQLYKCQVYIGTEIQDVTLQADARILTSAQMAPVTEYSYLESEIIRIPIPDILETGYYAVNGYGIFRYVNGDSYDDATDFNQMNDLGAKDEEPMYNAMGDYQISTAEELECFDTGTYKVTFRYDDSVNASMLPDGVTKETVTDPRVYITTSSETNVYLEPAGDHTLEVTTPLRAGTYPMQIRFIYGRGYTFELEKVD